MGYRYDDDVDYDYYADRHFAYVYQTPSERRGYVAPQSTSSDDGYDAQRDYNMEHYGNPKGLTEREMGQRWGSWDR